ncbi:hypothetical protein U8V72_23225 [Priestia filamentosa]|uniref:hypothetical protein n=1 Tax=Priestia filamentosa TaxID=1402861 RepID=UPI000589504C
MNTYQNEIPKHRKKINKSVKKSKHKHDYKLLNYTNAFEMINAAATREYWVTVEKKCSICHKTKNFTVFMSREEYLELLTEK